MKKRFRIGGKNDPQEEKKTNKKKYTAAKKEMDANFNEDDPNVTTSVNVQSLVQRKDDSDYEYIYDDAAKDADPNLGEIELAMQRKFNRDRTGFADTGYYDPATNTSYRAIGERHQNPYSKMSEEEYKNYPGVVRPANWRVQSKVGNDPNFSSNMGVKKKPHPFQGLLDLKRKPILSPTTSSLKLVDPLLKVYGRKLNSQTGQYVYDTSKGEIKKQRGKEDSQFVSQNRKAIDEMRKKYR
tara:strand:- start:1396 stop:2115 length:720 start_codon:yes stop_codon:yes gene_type:complete